MAKFLDALGKVSLVLAIAWLLISLLVYVVRGPLVYFVMMLGVILRPLFSLLFVCIAAKLCVISAGDALGRDWNFPSLVPSATRSSLLRDACTVTLLAFTIVFWYRYGGLGPSAKTHPGSTQPANVRTESDSPSNPNG